MGWQVGALVALGIGCLLVVILVPMSFGDLEYYEMGFTRNKATGAVDTTKVYFGGRHFVGVMSEFKVFKTTQFTKQYNNIAVFNKEKMQIIISCSLQFTLRPEDLKPLHDTYDVRYEPVIYVTARAAIKGAATQFSIDEFRLNRSLVADGMKKAVSGALDGNCCRKDCKKNFCRPGCMDYKLCKDDQKGMFSTVSGFQLRLVDLSPSQTKRFLRQVLEQELKDTEKFKQDEMITRKKTEEQKQQIDNLANEVAQNASADSLLIEKNAGVKSAQIIANAQNTGLAIIHNTLGIEKEEHKKTLDYVRTLREHKNSNLYIGFQYMVAKP